MRVLDPEQIHRLLEAAEPGLERTLLLTAITTGARMGELRALTWADFEHDRRRLWVRRSIGHAGVQQPKSRRSIRAIALPATVGAALLEYRLASRWSQADDLIFASSRGTPLDPANLRRIFRAALKRAGLPPMRFHDLRHCYASLLVAQGSTSPTPTKAPSSKPRCSVRVRTACRLGRGRDLLHGDLLSALASSLARWLR
jgi:integrase